MYWVRRTQVFLRRWRHSRGFGVQSPWAYRFVRYVVNEHASYYAYKDLQRQVTGISRLTRKLCRLYFRMANFRQPQEVYDFGAETSAYAEYMQRACPHAIINKVEATADPEPLLEGKPPVEMARISPTGNYRQFLESIRRHADDRTVVILEGINSSREVRAFWKEQTERADRGVTFDLYYCGILFFDQKRYQENYIINF